MPVEAWFGPRGTEIRVYLLFGSRSNGDTIGTQGSRNARIGMS